MFTMYERMIVMWKLRVNFAYILCEFIDLSLTFIQTGAKNRSNINSMITLPLKTKKLLTKIKK